MSLSQSLVYPDEVLVDLSRNFTLACWTALQVLSGQLDEDNNWSDNPVPRVLSMKQLSDRIDLSPQHFRVHIALLQGANAITINPGHRDSREKAVSISQNGLRLLTLKTEREM